MILPTTFSHLNHLQTKVLIFLVKGRVLREVNKIVYVFFTNEDELKKFEVVKSFIKFIVEPFQNIIIL